MEDKKQCILIADDDQEIREVVRLLLTGEGFSVIEADGGESAVKLISPKIDLYILDVMMPGLSGFSVCDQIRKSSNAPILFLTAKSGDPDKTMAFSVGADDYLSKPFSYSELLGRVKAMLRRYYVYGGGEIENAENEPLEVGALLIDRAAKTVKKSGRDVVLTDTEYEILLLLCSNRQKIFSTQNIYESVWNEPYFYPSSNTVMVHIRNLRRKLGDDEGALIRTVWGKGYRIG